MTKDKKLVLLLLLILLAFGLLVVFVFDVKCLFKSIFDFPCPGCGLTRAFRALFQGNIIKACSYNILVLPIFFFLFVLCITIFTDFIKKSNYMDKYLLFFKKHYIIIILFVIISYIVNLINFF